MYHNLLNLTHEIPLINLTQTGHFKTKSFYLKLTIIWIKSLHFALFQCGYSLFEIQLQMWLYFIKKMPTPPPPPPPYFPQYINMFRPKGTGSCTPADSITVSDIVYHHQFRPEYLCKQDFNADSIWANYINPSFQFTYRVPPTFRWTISPAMANRL